MVTPRWARLPPQVMADGLGEGGRRQVASSVREMVQQARKRALGGCDTMAPDNWIKEYGVVWVWEGARRYCYSQPRNRWGGSVMWLA